MRPWRALPCVPSPPLILGLLLLVGLVAVQPLAAGSPAAKEAPVEMVRVAPRGTVTIVVTGGACAAGKTVLVSGKPITSRVRRNGMGVVRVRARAGRIFVSFHVPPDIRPGRYPVTMRCLSSAADTVGRLIPGAKVIVIVTA